MNITKLLGVIFSVFILSGCAPSSSDGGGDASLKCADVHNGTTSDCSKLAGLSIAGVTAVDTGTVSRGSNINATLEINNLTPSQWQGYWQMVFNAGCGGASTWEIMPLQETPLVEIGGVLSTRVGGSCSDMPLGRHTLTATLYGIDATTVMDVVQVNFELTD